MSCVYYLFGISIIQINFGHHATLVVMNRPAVALNCDSSDCFQFFSFTSPGKGRKSRRPIRRPEGSHTGEQETAGRVCVLVSMQVSKLHTACMLTILLGNWSQRDRNISSNHTHFQFNNFCISIFDLVPPVLSLNKNMNKFQISISTHI